MKVLIVGCGAVGQVFGLYLQKAGVELGLYDRPATADRLQQALEHGGLPIFEFPRSRGQEPIARAMIGREFYRVGLFYVNRFKYGEKGDTGKE